MRHDIERIIELIVMFVLGILISSYFSDSPSPAEDPIPNTTVFEHNAAYLCRNPKLYRIVFRQDAELRYEEMCK